jgi:hypothetical protein
MVLGGVAHYLKLLNPRYSFVQNSASYQGSINTIMITVNGVKKNEYYEQIITDDITLDKLFLY